MLRDHEEFTKNWKRKTKINPSETFLYWKKNGLVGLDCNQMLKTFKKLPEQRQENRNWQRYILYKYERSVKIVN